MIQKALIVICIFVLGFIASNLFSNMAEAQKQAPEGDSFEFSSDSTLGKLLGLSGAGNEIESPKDRIAENQIQVNDERVQINIKDAVWASFTDTNSMDPVIDDGANAIEVKPESVNDVEVGDIVAYESEYAEGTIIHRVIQKSNDTQGTYFIMKGDNNPTADPGRVRFSQIKSVVVAIIY